MKFLSHPILSAVGIESLLSGLFVVFHVGPCTAPVIGIAILYLHYPALLLAGRIAQLTGWWDLAMTPLLMLPIWIALLYLLRFALRPRHTNRNQDANVA